MKKIPITFLATPIEKELLENRAYNEKKTLSSYCRSTLLDVDRKMITNQNILFQLSKIDNLSDTISELKQTKESGNLNILIELLLYMRCIVEPTKRKMVASELKRINVKAWDNK